MLENTVQKICEYLDQQSVIYTLISHNETRTSEESASVRAEQGFIDVAGAKAILMKLEQGTGTTDFFTFVLPSHLKLNSKVLKRQFNDVKSCRFATVEELANLTGGLVPGSLPPFAAPIFPSINALFIDEALLEYNSIAFNAASLNRSIILDCEEYMRVACATAVFSFA